MEHSTDPDSIMYPSGSDLPAKVVAPECAEPTPFYYPSIIHHHRFHLLYRRAATLSSP
jgi:hypothetical protein